ncbi:MAG TPA: LuxR C-terminal-related transcriptional regulator, partial [Gemmatimonadales bacterium]|nr:LuxR C-terminal-related transcriptional regulator [Gemmatimonadales bacterium]
ALADYEASGAPFETARTRLDLAATLATLGQTPAAERETRTALASFESLGAEGEANRARDRLAAFGKGARKAGKGNLTDRQVEILKLVAQGLSNPEIATRLKLSDHTVKRHVANLLTKLGLSSRTAAAAYAAQEGLL